MKLRMPVVFIIHAFTTVYLVIPLNTEDSSYVVLSEKIFPNPLMTRDVEFTENSTGRSYGNHI